MQAELERAEREHQVRISEQRKRSREEVRQLQLRAALLREEGRFADAEKIDRNVQGLLRHQDPDLVLGNELKQRAAAARLDGKHQDAELFDRQADELLKKAAERYRQVDSETDASPAVQDRSAP